ncbi:MAG: galactokinase [Arcticibacterium sp.]|jgi:galactokinase
MSLERVSGDFKNTFGVTPKLKVRAPGRINLIGEHTDYNDGFVLPAAIDKAIIFCLSPRKDTEIHLKSVDLDDTLTISLESLQKTEKGWANFLIGVVKEIQDSGKDIQYGFNLAFGGDVPLGAGLSSSAAIESGIGFAINEMYSLGFSRLELALMAQKAEHNFAGVRCGIMDMYASIMGKKNQVIRLDCKNLTHTYLPFNSDNLSIVLFNTGVSHNLAESEYNKRREECEAGLNIIKKHYPEVTSFRDVKRNMLESHKLEFNQKVYNRCDYVIAESERMEKATMALQNNDMGSFGKLMYQTHDGLQNLYEVSCDELDFLVDLARRDTRILGARMMGGGFGGCTINLIQKENIDKITETFISEYATRFGSKPESYTVKIMDGCSLI